MAGKPDGKAAEIARLEMELAALKGGGDEGGDEPDDNMDNDDAQGAPSEDEAPEAMAQKAFDLMTQDQKNAFLLKAVTGKAQEKIAQRTAPASTAAPLETGYDEDGLYVETYSPEGIGEVIGAEFVKALEPLFVEMASLRDENAQLSKAVEEQGELLEEIGENQEVIRKSLDSSLPETEKLLKAVATKQDEQEKHSAAVGETKPTSGMKSDEILQKGLSEDGLTSEEAEEVETLIQKAQRIHSEHFVQPAGYLDAVDARNDGEFTRQHLSVLRKGVTDATEQLGIAA